MRIPLDYYRILGLPIQATADQLKQARGDRIQQLPRREYSDLAIDARKQLIDEAYAVLSDPDQRGAYDMGFLAKTYDLPSNPSLSGVGGEKDTDSHRASIEIDDRQLVGALLILQELGEYEQVVAMTRPWVGTSTIGLKDGRFGDPDLVVPDMVLTVALAYLELGREQWQSRQYENAAISLESGQDLLLRESLFASLRGEMQADLYKLRPYRIIELLQLPEVKTDERRRGLQLLREMLHERGGIDGHGDDRSGLNVEDFLRFIQQLRSSLTTTEQQTLFEMEAHRPSAVSTYLAVYALLAQGFARAQPALIRKAKLMLMQLGRRQDVHLEKAVCCLLLGQTEEASRALDLSQEQEAIAFIRENSVDSPDLLPGLCLYAEHWLAEEVFPHFRDLQNQSVSLKEYFANKQVQSYLEALPGEARATSNEWVVVQPRRSSRSDNQLSYPERATTQTVSTSANPATSAPYSSTPDGMSNGTGSPTGSVAHANWFSQSSSSGTPSPSAQVPQTPPPGRLNQSTNESTYLQKPARGSSSTSPETARVASSSPGLNSEPTANLPPLGQGSPQPNSPRRTRGKGTHESNYKVKRLILVGLVGLFGIWLLWMILSAIFGWIGNALEGMGGPRLTADGPEIRLDNSPIAIPEPEPENPLAADLNPTVAQQVVNTWLTAKAAALGPEHQTQGLREILVEPSLTRWIGVSDSLRQENSHRRFQHEVRVQSVDVNENNPNQGTVDAQVREVTQFYQGNQMERSEDSTLQVRYQLVRDQGPWRIRDWDIIR
ncbi:MAG: DUF4101 domain-containing protein [Arthrospira sp. PLM2.Bin9]|nr:IMS domain-containing protein [Arthrospira sp. PLM2.Bin9]TVU55721.1 MAG: DUF4101 domain-containing protein [Arthrospira sp. PLM2.Bin9]